jgi:hypothetical protein
MAKENGVLRGASGKLAGWEPPIQLTRRAKSGMIRISIMGFFTATGASSKLT